MNVKGYAMKPLAYNSPATLNTICLGLTRAKNFSLNLERQDVVNVPDAVAMRVTCVEGDVWLTLNNDPRDIVLQPGDVFTTPAHAGAIVYALKPSRVTLAPALPAAPARRLQPLGFRSLWQSANPALAASAIWS
jgi:Protein of unknown function (DUF2917)